MNRIIHKLVAKDGQYMVMPPWCEGQVGWGNMAHPEVYEETAQPAYPIGTKFVDGDRIWRYVQAGNSIVRGRGLAAWNAYSTPTSGDGTTRETATIAAAQVIDATTLSCTDQGTITVADLFAGGYAMVYWEFLCLRVVSSTIEDASGLFEVTIDRPLPVAIANTSNVTLYRNKYADVRYFSGGANMQFGSYVCVSHYTATDTYYFWGQTWGPAGMSGTDHVGASGDERQVVFDQGGSLLVHSADTTKSYQHAGYLIPYTGPSTGGQDQPGAFIFVELQIAP